MERARQVALPTPRLLPRLAPPPRRVPLTVRVRLLFGGFGLVAWLVLGLTTGLASPFLVSADLGGWRFGGEVARAPGVSLGCEDTGASVGSGRASIGGGRRRGTPVYANRYRFEADGHAFEDVAYATGRCLEAGREVTVEHLPGDPAVARIAGMRRDTFGPGVAFVAVFPLVGLALVVASLLRGLHRVRLLAEGRLALGTLVGKEATPVELNERRVMRLRFALTTETGARREVVVRTSRPEVLEDEPRERILYDPRRPDRAVAWDALGVTARLDATGALAPAGVLGSLLLLVPPAVVLAALALVVGHVAPGHRASARPLATPAASEVEQDR